MYWKKLRKFVRENVFLLGVVFLVSVLMFANLGDRPLWGDEAEVAMLAQNILKFGYPFLDDGRNFLYTDYEYQIRGIPEAGANRAEQTKIWTYHPWAPHYFVAFTFFLFDVSNFTSRLPFAIFGILSVILTYFVAVKLTGSKYIGKLSILLLSFYVPFYLYSRQVKYFSLAMLMVLSVIYSYLMLVKKEPYGAHLFILSSVLLFYSNSVPFFGTYAGIIVHLLAFNRQKKLLQNFSVISLIVAALTLPWFIYARVGSISSGFDALRILFSMVNLSAYFFVYTVPFVLILVLIPVLFKRKKRNISLNRDYMLLVLIVFFTMFAVTLAPWDLPAFRYLSSMFPVAMLLVAIVVAWIFKYNKRVGIVVVILLVATNFLHVGPFKFFENSAVDGVGSNEAKAFIEDNLRLRFFLYDYLYEITHHYENQHSRVVEYLLEHGDREDSFLTNAGDLVYIFYTDMRAYKITDKDPPDWIIPRESYFLWYGDERNSYDFVLSKIDDRYEEIIIDGTDQIYPLDSPHPRTHIFKTNDESRNKEDYPQQSYPIRIYHLRDQ